MRAAAVAIRAARLRAGLTRERVLVEVALRGGSVSLSSLKRWEATGNPKLDDLAVLAGVYGVSISELIGQDEGGR